MPNLSQVHAFSSIPSRFTMDETFKIARKRGKERDWLKGKTSVKRSLIKELICYYLRVPRTVIPEEAEEKFSPTIREPSLLRNLIVCVCVLWEGVLWFSFKMVTFWSGIAWKEAAHTKQEIYVCFFLLRNRENLGYPASQICILIAVSAVTAMSTARHWALSPLINGANTTWCHYEIWFLPVLGSEGQQHYSGPLGDLICSLCSRIKSSWDGRSSCNYQGEGITDQVFTQLDSTQADWPVCQ